MKPNPLSLLNNLTLPVGMQIPSSGQFSDRNLAVNWCQIKQIGCKACSLTIYPARGRSSRNRHGIVDVVSRPAASVLRSAAVNFATFAQLLSFRAEPRQLWRRLKDGWRMPTCKNERRRQLSERADGSAAIETLPLGNSNAGSPGEVLKAWHPYVYLQLRGDSFWHHPFSTFALRSGNRTDRQRCPCNVHRKEHAIAEGPY